MNGKAIFERCLAGVLILVLAFPPGGFAQSSGARTGFTQEELDQMLAPIALYPDSLLAQVLVAATYPEQVVEADRWVKENSGLKGDQLNAALDRMDWDLSVKALVPFPKVLDMMSTKREWTQKLGEAFLADQEKVMDSVQNLRSKAYAQGHLKDTREQKVVVRGESVEIVSADPEAVYVPIYNPAVVYGPWWYPAYPPFAFSPFYPAFVYDPYYVVPGVVAVGAFAFATAITVGAFWHVGWGHWDWGRRNVVVNVNRTVNINRTTNIRSTSIRTTSLQTAVRQGKIGSPAARSAARQISGKRPTAASVQKGLQQRQTEARSGQRKGVSQGKQTAVRDSRGRGKELRGQKSTQRGEKSLTRGKQGVTRGAKGISQGGKRISRGTEKAQRGDVAGRGREPRGAGGPKGGGEKREHKN